VAAPNSRVIALRVIAFAFAFACAFEQEHRQFPQGPCEA